MSRPGTIRAAVLVLVLVLAQTACERHAASETVPGYAEKLAEKKAAEQKQATTPQTVNPTPPKFFHGEK